MGGSLSRNVLNAAMPNDQREPLIQVYLKDEQIDIFKSSNKHETMSDLSEMSTFTNENDIPETELHSYIDNNMDKLEFGQNGWEMPKNFRDYCSFLNDRVQKMEDQNNQMRKLAEKQKNEYNKVAAQVVYSEMMRRGLQTECMNLRRQVDQLYSYNQQLVKNQTEKKDTESLDVINPMSQNENISKKNESYVDLHSSVHQQNGSDIPLPNYPYDNQLQSHRLPNLNKENSLQYKQEMDAIAKLYEHLQKPDDQIVRNEDVTLEEKLYQCDTLENTITHDNLATDDHALQTPNICTNKSREVCSSNNVSENKLPSLTSHDEEELSKYDISRFREKGRGKKNKFGCKLEDGSFDNNSYLEVELKNFKQSQNNSPNTNQFSNFQRNSSVRRSYNCSNNANHKSSLTQRPSSFILDGDTNTNILVENNAEKMIKASNPEHQNNNVHQKFTNDSSSVAARKPYCKRSSSFTDLPPPPLPPPQSDLSEVDDSEEYFTHEYDLKNGVASVDQNQKYEKSLSTEQTKVLLNTKTKNNVSGRHQSAKDTQENKTMKSLGWRRKSYTSACHKSKSFDHLYEHLQKNNFSTLQLSQKSNDNTPTSKNSTADRFFENQNEDDFPPPPPPHMLLQHNNKQLDNNNDYECMNPIQNCNVITGFSPKLPERNKNLLIKPNKSQVELNETIETQRNINIKSTNYQNGLLKHQKPELQKSKVDSQLPTRRHRSTSDDARNTRKGGQKLYQIQPTGLNSLPQTKSTSNNKSDQPSHFSIIEYKNKKSDKSRISSPKQEINPKLSNKNKTHSTVLNKKENSSVTSGSPNQLKGDSLSNDKKKHNSRSQDATQKSSFVNIMKAKFTRPSSGNRLLSSSKKTARISSKNKSNNLHETPIEPTKSNIDPRTLSLNPNTYLSFEKDSEYRKASKKLLGKNSDSAVGRKLSQTSLKSSPSVSSIKPLSRSIKSTISDERCESGPMEGRDMTQNSYPRYNGHTSNYVNSKYHIMKNNQSARISIEKQIPENDHIYENFCPNDHTKLTSVGMKFKSTSKYSNSKMDFGNIPSKLQRPTSKKNVVYNKSPNNLNVSIQDQSLKEDNSSSSDSTGRADKEVSTINHSQEMTEKDFISSVVEAELVGKTNLPSSLTEKRGHDVKTRQLNHENTEFVDTGSSFGSLPSNILDSSYAVIDNSIYSHTKPPRKKDTNRCDNISGINSSNTSTSSSETNNREKSKIPGSVSTRRDIVESKHCKKFSNVKTRKPGSTSPNEVKEFSKRLAPLNYGRPRPSNIAKPKGLTPEPIYENASVILHRKHIFRERGTSFT